MEMKKSGGGGSGGHKMKARFFFSPLFALLLAAILPLIFYSSSPSSPLPLFVLQLLPHNPLNMYDLSTIKDMACIQFHPILHFFNAIFHCPSLNAATKTSGPSVVDEQQSQLLFNSNNPSPSPCIFCDISNTGHGQTRIVYQDSKFIAFNDVNPSAKEHILIIPREHIETINNLNAHTTIVSEMKALGKQLLDERNIPSSDQRFGFHVPPFTSVAHLHLHVLGLPFKNWVRSLKYPTDEYGWWERWWISADRLIASQKSADDEN